MSDIKNVNLKIITPNRTFFQGDATMVEFNTTEGELGIYPNHVPMTVIVKPGVLRITTEEEVKVAALHAGFVEILPESITILAEVIEWPGEIDPGRAELAKERAEQRLREAEKNTDVARAETALLRSIARIKAVK
ncbi:MAG: ATP synthase F1 subunit epsilon [Eubacteriales bacterium]